MFGAYVRVSTVGQNEVSQKQEISTWARAHNIRVRWYIDKESGDSLRTQMAMT